MSPPGDEQDRSLSAYRFDLDDGQIARRPLENRSASRLLVLGPEGPPAHHTFSDLPTLLQAGDRLVVNDSTVIPARLFAERAGTGGKVEVLLCRPGTEAEGGRQPFICMVRPAKKLRPGVRLVFGEVEEPFFAVVGERLADEPGAMVIEFEGDPIRFAEAYGGVPIPPYFDREDDDDDRERYQTIYAHPDKPGSAAAPTAGLHFTQTLLDELAGQGIGMTRVTLHVGPGTFLPVRTDDIAEHQMHPEPWSLSAEAAEQLNTTLEQGGRLVAVGTTSLRVLESAFDAGAGRFAAGSGLTRLFLRPGVEPQVVRALITNFHLPESSLLMLVAAFSGRERILAAYAEAASSGYRFYSYGDACLLTRGSP